VSTMREEFEAWKRRECRAFAAAGGKRGWDGVAELAWQAAYAAGQRADTALLKQALEALEHCNDWLPEDSSARMGAISAIDDLVAAIRARDKERG